MLAGRGCPVSHRVSWTRESPQALERPWCWLLRAGLGAVPTFGILKQGRGPQRRRELGAQGSREVGLVSRRKVGGGGENAVTSGSSWRKGRGGRWDLHDAECWGSTPGSGREVISPGGVQTPLRTLCGQSGVPWVPGSLGPWRTECTAGRRRRMRVPRLPSTLNRKRVRQGYSVRGGC